MTHRHLLPIGFVAAMLTAAMLPALGDDGTDPARLVAAVRNGTMRPGAAVRVQGFRLNTGLGSVVLTEGILVPANQVGDRTVELAFVGDGRVRMEPPDEVERGQLELFTGSRVLDQRFGRAVFVIAYDEATDVLGRLPTAAGDFRIDSAASLFDRWRGSQERRLLEVDSRILMDAVGDPIAQSFFCGYFDDSDLGSFLYVVDPLSDEQVTVGQFVRADLSDRERREAERHLAREQRRGKLIGLELEDFGIWDTWVSASLRTPEGRVAPGTTGVEPDNYTVDLVLRGRRLLLEGTARIDATVTVDGLRVVNLELDHALTARRVTDGAGRELTFLRSHGELTVLLPGPLAAGSATTVEVQYSGDPFERLSSGSYIQRKPLSWYPHAGSVDRATYDVTIRWPKKHELYGSGRVVDEGVDRDGQRWQRRELDIRSLGFSFEIGDYSELTDRVGDVEVTVAIDRLGRKVARGLGREVLDAVCESLSFYEAVYGPYPLDELVVVSSPRAYSQGLLGFVTLSTAGIMDWDMWGSLLGFEDRRTLIAHEIAHQWWGNEVGWSGYRDQWISEAVANYSALLFERRRLRGRSDKPLWTGPTTGWKTELLKTTADGRRVESLGPVVLGSRLNSSLSSHAYHAIVYKKGAVVLDMLARFFGEETFLEILREIVGRASGKVLSTDTFLLMVGRLGGADLEWFTRQYVNGTGLPEIYYDYRIQSTEVGRWVVEGEARQNAPYRFEHRVVRRSDGALDVVREMVTRLDVSDSVLVVPVQIGMADGGEASAPSLQDRRFTVGTVLLAGELSPFRFELDERPEIMWLDRDGEVFGRFFCASRWPKRIAYFRGLDQYAAGDLELAEATLLSALDEVVARIPPSWKELEGDLDREAGIVDARIHLALARLYLDSDRPDQAAGQLTAASDALPREERWRFSRLSRLIEARLAIRTGESARAVRLLGGGSARRGGLESAEEHALLSVAAYLAGKKAEFLRACRRAGELGVDLGPLQCE